MKNKIENGKLTFYLEGRIDSNNSGEIESELNSTIEANPGVSVSIDAENLEYISSAGLRVLLKVRKQIGSSLAVDNVSPEVFDIFEVTGFTDLLDVRKRMREISVEGCEMIGSGGFGKVYRLDPETIVKVFSPGITLDMVQHERDTAQKAFLAGVPTAISYDVVKSGDSYGVVYELLNARTVAQIIDADPARIEEMGRKSGKLLRHLHEIEMGEGVLPDRKQELLKWLTNVEYILEPAETEMIRGFIQSIPDRHIFLHGDFNSKNIMVQEDGELILIDIGDATIGHPVFDVAGLVLPYLYLPKANIPEEERRRLLGFRLEDGPKMWDVIIREYFSLRESGESALIADKVMPVAELMSRYHGIRRTGYDQEYMRNAALPIIRQRLLPLIKNAEPVDW